MSPPLLPQDITMTETEETVLDPRSLVKALLQAHDDWSGAAGTPLYGEAADALNKAEAAVVAALSRAPEAGREGAAERLAIVAEKPAHLIRWGEGDRLDLQSILAALSPPSTAPRVDTPCWRCNGEGCIQEGSPEAWNYADCPDCGGKPFRSPPSTGGGGEAVANQVGAAEAEVGRYVYRRIERLMDAKPGTVEGAKLCYLAEIAEGVEEYGEQACDGHPLGRFPPPSPEMGEISPYEIAEIMREHLSGEFIGETRAAKAILSKLKENGLSREELGGLARSQPRCDAQERSPVPPLSDGWLDIESTTPPHATAVLLGWQDSRGGCWISEVAAYSTGERFDNGYSNLSLHGSATHWMPLPSPPQNSDGEDA